MYEKVNPAHPDKIADRIAGAIVDFMYTLDDAPKVAVEVLVGHGFCNVMIETTVPVQCELIPPIIKRLAGDVTHQVLILPQDPLLAKNQADTIRCGDNGIFKGVPITDEQKRLSILARSIYAAHPYDGKYILDGDRMVICQSNADTATLRALYPNADVNPLGDWTGGLDVDCGATNRKLGSDMGDAVTGGGLHGKDLSKADVTLNIYAFLKAQSTKAPVELSCAIGDEVVDGHPYSELVDIAREFIHNAGGFEKFAEWGLI